MSFYKPTSEERERESRELSDFLEGKVKKPVVEKVVEVPLEEDKIQVETISLPAWDIEKNGRYAAPDIYYEYDKSLSDLQTLGFTDHLPIDLQMGFLIAELEGGLGPNGTILADELLKKRTEFTSELIATKDNTIIIYNNNHGLSWDKNNKRYSLPTNGVVPSRGQYNNLKFKRLFGIFETELKVRPYEPTNLEKVSKLSSILIVRLYGRPYEELPDKIKYNTRLTIPAEGEILPLCKGNIDSPYHIFPSTSGISRGCKPK